MSSHTSTKADYNRPHTPSIRDELERRAWIQNPGLATRLSNRPNNHLGKCLNNPLKDEKHYNDSTQDSERRYMQWQERILLALGIFLLMLFVIRCCRCTGLGSAAAKQCRGTYGTGP